MNLILFFLLVAVSSTYALETDNYLSWGITLPDSGDDVNELVSSQIEDVLASTKKNTSCEQVTFRIANRFKTTPTRKLFEDWTLVHLKEKMFPQTPFYLHHSIYRNTARFYLRNSGMSPNLQTNGIYFGIDKLSHFGSTGRRYLKEYLKKMRKGYSAEEAERSAIRLGLNNEARVLGLWPSGVFSYGDMEANFQGFLFYKRLCLDDENTYLTQVDGRWKLAVSPDIRDFVNPYWDESFNLSFRGKGMWNVSSRVIQKEYCPLRDRGEVQARFSMYQERAEKSRSLTYIEELQARGYRQAPVPSRTQSVDKLCQL